MMTPAPDDARFRNLRAALAFLRSPGGQVSQSTKAPQIFGGLGTWQLASIDDVLVS
jgi:hypothetical protein